MIKKELLFVLGLLAFITACGGGGGGSSALNNLPTSTSGSTPTTPISSNSSAPTTAQSVTMSLTITIPKKTTTASNVRSPQYIAANSGSMTLSLLSVNGSAASSTTQGPFNLTPGTGNPNCVSTNGVTTCTFSISAPVGTDVFLANTYSTTNGTGQSLGSGSILLSVRLNAANSANLVLTGPVATVQVVSATTALYNGNPVVEDNSSSSHRSIGTPANRARIASVATQGTRKPAATTGTPSPPGPVTTTSRIFVIALDAVGNQIINPTTFDIPIQLQLALNGMPAGSATLSVAYAGLTGEPSSPASISTDGGSVTVFAPSDTVTMTVSGSGSQSSAYAPTVTAAYTPQGGSAQMSAPLTFSVYIPPAAAYLALSATHVDPWLSNSSNNVLTMAISNAGTASTSGQITVNFYGSSWSYVNDTGSDPSWSCNGSGNSITCVTSAVIAPGASLPLIAHVNEGSPCCGDYNDAYASGGAPNAENGSLEAYDPINVNNVASASFGLSVTADRSPMYATAAESYTLSVANNGSAATSGTITVADTLPANFAYSGYSGAGWTCTGAGPNILSCTYPAVIAASGSANALTLDVTPASSTTDTTVTDSATVSGGGASPNGPVSTQTYVSSPVVFSGTTGFPIGTQYGNTFTSGDAASIKIGSPPTMPSPSPLTGTISLTTYSSASATYAISSDNCTNVVIDSQFSSHFPHGVAAVGTPQSFPLSFMGTTAAEGPCSLVISDNVGNTATLTLSVGLTNITVQQNHRNAGGNR